MRGQPGAATWPPAWRASGTTVSPVDRGVPSVDGGPTEDNWAGPRWIDRRRGRGVLVLIALLVSAERRYGPIDLTDPGWKVNVHNDLSQPIRVKDGAENLPIGPGNSEVLVSPSPGALRPRYVVTDGAARTLGCLTVDLDRSRTVDARASSMRFLLTLADRADAGSAGDACLARRGWD